MEEDDRVFNTMLGTEEFNPSTGEVYVTSSIDSTTKATVDCSEKANAEAYNQCKGNNGTIQKVKEGKDVPFILICTVLILMIIILLLMQIRRWY